MELIFNVEKQVMTRTDSLVIASHSKKVHSCSFTFSEEWQNMEKSATFKKNHITYDVLLDNDACTIPSEVLRSAGAFEIGVYGSDGQRTITSNLVSVEVVAGSPTEGVESRITPSLYEQIIKKINEVKKGEVEPELILEAVNEYLTEHPIDDIVVDEVAAYVTEHASELKGNKGDKGDRGEKGEQGIQGIQGERGEQGLKGDKGEKGAKGDTGESGKSAYQIAVDNGYSGTESEWLASLKGDDGESYDDTEIKADISVLSNEINSVANLSSIENLIDRTNLVSNSRYKLENGARITTKSETGMSRTSNAIILYPNVTYKYNDLHAVFCYVVSYDGSRIIKALSSDVSGSADGFYTPKEKCKLYISILSTNANTAYVIKSNECNMVVDLNGNGDFTSIVEAVNFANSLSAPCNIMIAKGEYDLYEELGGDSWLEGQTGTASGLKLADNVNLIGIGNAILTMYLPDTVTYNQSAAISAINLVKTTNKIENITVKVKNCRYAIHDEVGSGNDWYLKRIIKNCRFYHLGNISNIWSKPIAYGCGMGGGSVYEFINSQFISQTQDTAFYIHTSSNWKTPSHVSVDGCVGIVNSSAGNSFKCSYYGTNQQGGKTVFNIKNCSGNGAVIKVAEDANSSDHIELYVNGYNQLAEWSE